MKTIKSISICLFFIFSYAITTFAADYTATVYTPKNSSVTVIVRDVQELTPEQKAQAHRDVIAVHPNVKKLRDATKKYNCHSYAWYSTSTSNSYWMNNPSKYMTDGSYTLKAEPAVGYKVAYIKDSTVYDHSGIIVGISAGAKVQSKWGDFGLYEHNLLDVPYAKVVKFYAR